MARNNIEINTLSNSDLRETNPVKIINYIEKNWRQIRVHSGVEGLPAMVPIGWSHGGGRKGEYFVDYGDVLTTEMGGTKLAPGIFTEWLAEKGFSFESDNQTLSAAEAAAVLASKARGQVPVFRAIRTGRNHAPVLIEFYSGSQSDLMQKLTRLGNQNLNLDGKEQYRSTVFQLMEPFLSKGTTKAKDVLGLHRDKRKIRRIDDCAAALTTVLGHIIISDKSLGHTRQILEVDDYAVATLQALAIRIHLAERRGVPLIVRAGGPSFGLAGADKGLNYMLNTQPQMLQLGPFTSGDFGVNMSTGGEQNVNPHIKIHGENPREKIQAYLNNQIYLFLNGGWPILQMMDGMYKLRNKPLQGVVHVLRASRVDNGPKHWGVIMSSRKTD